MCVLVWIAPRRMAKLVALWAVSIFTKSREEKEFTSWVELQTMTKTKQQQEQELKTSAREAVTGSILWASFLRPSPSLSPSHFSSPGKDVFRKLSTILL